MSQRDKVLVCDDQPMNVKLMARSLSLFGYEVLTAANGEEAIRIARESSPDIILLDIMMPKLNGYDVTQILKRDSLTRTIPIVLITALSGDDDKLKGLEAGASDFLTKPVNQTELLTRVRSLVKLKKMQDQVNANANMMTSRPSTSGPVATEHEEKYIVMIIEDDPTQIKYIENQLDTGGYDTIVANNASEALDILNEAIPDLILLDILLPDMDGVVLLEMLRALPEIRPIPILIISAFGDLDIKVKSFDTGADDYLVKPINTVEMMARIKSNLIKYDFQKKVMAIADDYKTMADNYKATIDGLFKQTIIDSLTGLNNRYYLNTVMEREVGSSKRYDYDFCLMMLDVDHFKSINDTYGHISGDSVLREMGALTKQAIRTIDSAIRYGGEEFLLVLPHTAIQEASLLAQRIRKSVENHKFSDVGDRQITISIGVAQFQKSDNDMHKLIKRADEALYRAKKGGRNRVELG